MSNIKALKETIDRLVFTSDKPIVIALKGGWGEGKTHFWKNTILPSYSNLSIGYVSVFGADSIQSIREKVVLSALPKLSNTGKGMFGGAIETFRNNLPSLLTKFGIPDTLMVQLVEGWALKPGWVVCLDDIERLSESVGIDVLLGYINELRDERRLKVVLIYNHEGSATSSDSFKKYQEKVIDRELPFLPDVSEVVRLVFDGIPSVQGNVDLLQELARRCEVIELRNIRLLAKARDYYQELSGILPADADANFRAAVLYSLLLFVWTKYSNSALPTLTLDSLEDYSELATLLREDGRTPQQNAEGPDKAKELLMKFGYAFTDDLDKIMIRFVRSDLLDVEGTKAEYEKYAHNATKGFHESKFRKVWQQYYHGTLRNNEDEFCNALVVATREYLPLIPINQLDSSLTMLSRLDRVEEAEVLLNDFCRLRNASLNQVRRADLLEPIKYQRLAEILQGIQNEANVDRRSIGEVLNNALADDFLRSADRQRLSEFTAQDLVEYFSNNDQEALTSVMRELGKMASRITNPDENDVKVQTLVREAATEIAKQSRLNRLRMESMGLVDNEPQ